MRYPLNGTIFVTNPHGEPGYGHFGKHAGLDLRASIGTPFYAPEDGVINENYTGKSGTKVLGLASPKYWHRFLHIDRAVVKVGERVKEGQLLGYTGNTGNVPAHLHWDIRKPNTAWNASYANYYSPKTLITSATQPKPQGEEMIADRQQAELAYILLRGTPGSEAELNATAGKRTWVEFASSGRAEVNNREAYKKQLEKQVADQQKTLDTQSKQIAELNGQLAVIKSSVDELNKRPTQDALDKLQSSYDSLAKDYYAALVKKSEETPPSVPKPQPKPKPFSFSDWFSKFIKDIGGKK